MNHLNKILLIVVSMTLILGFSIDVYTPSFPAIASEFKTSNQWVQLTIATYFLGYVLGMAFLGPLSDAVGRKKPLLVGISFYCLMSFLCTLSEGIYMLLLLRLLQGVGVSAVGVMCRSILGDAFTGRRLAVAMTYFMMSYRIGPIIAPLIGGYLEVFIGWRASFYFLTFYALLILGLIAFLLPETHLERFSIHPKAVASKYASLLRLRPFIGGSLCIGMLYSMMIIFNVIGPFFIQGVLGYSPISYGHIAFILGVFAFLGIFANRFLIRHHSPEKMIATGIYSMVAITVLQVVFAFIFPVNLYSFLIPVMALLFASGLVVSNFLSVILDSIPRGMGTSSALNAIISITIAGTLTAFSSFLKSDTAIPFSFAFLAIMLASFFCYKWLFCRGLSSSD